MKRLLISAAMLLAVAGMRSNAQCFITNLGVNLKSYTPSTCHVVFDLSWEQEVNNGNKYAYVHLWTGANYHTPAANWALMYTNPAAYPNAADLVNALGTICIYENSSATPKIGPVYLPDAPGVNPLTTGLTVVKTPLPGGLRERMTINNIDLTLASCANVVSVKADVWASQAANGKNVHCASQGLSFNLNNPRVTGFKICEPRSISFGIANNDPVETITVYYRLYKDDGDEVFEPGTGPGLDGDPIQVSSDITILPLQSWSVTKMAYPGSTMNGETGSLWVEVITKVPAFSFVAIGKLADPGCVPLPVSFGNFTAGREAGSVWLRWETLTEINNTGFVPERKTDGNWEALGFVNTRATDGNSTVFLSYTFEDPQRTRGIAQYRIRQVSRDGKISYSEIRAVRDEGATNDLTVYPNPACNGKINIVFADGIYTRDISITDMAGRMVKRYPQVSGEVLVVNDLRPGLYIVRVITKGVAEPQVKKIVVY